MRRLNTDELLDKFRDYATDIEYCDFKDSSTKIDHFLYFLWDQAISKRILERIYEDFDSVKTLLKDCEILRPNHESINLIKQELVNRELQGAFGFFCIDELYKSTGRRHDIYYIDLGDLWYRAGRDYYRYQEKFNTHFFKPFTELFEWYMYESQTKKNADYFSMESQNLVLEELSEIKSMLMQNGIGQNIIFEEIEEQAELIKFLDKKNWLQHLKGKVFGLVSGKILESEQAEKLINQLQEFVSNIPK